MDKYSYLSNADGSVIDDLYQQYLNDPTSVEFGWQKFFEGFEFSRKNYEETGEVSENMHKEFKVLNLINGYRTRGHLFTKTNPVRERRKYAPTLDVENFGLSEADLETVFEAGAEVGMGPSKLKDIVHHLECTYCQSIGIEYRYIRTPEKLKWIQDKMDAMTSQPELSVKVKKQILHKLNQAVVFENFLHTKFPGQKRFSLEGAETMIPALDAAVEYGADLGMEEFVFGMAHRGRLNVLANIFNKTYSEIFSEFEPKDYEDSLFDGDVKYHLGYTCDVTTDNGKDIHMTLAPNPSHLEAVDPVVEGIARAKIDKNYEGDNSKVCPILIHGDAAVAGQGIVYEVVQMAGLNGYATGGTIHIVINNQVGFTTNYLDARSSTYCTDVAKVTLCPVFHVNGDDVEALIKTVKFAIEYRQRYKKDVFIDLLCYRKYGHNEGDEPKFTQPMLYKAIAKHPNPREIYNQKLQQQGDITASLAKEMEQEFKALLQERLNEAKQITSATITSFLEEIWDGVKAARPEDFETSPKTGVSKKTLASIGHQLSVVPEGKKFFRKLERILNDRRKMIDENRLDWGMGEMLAYGTLLLEGHPVRISGQDVERGTFSHRHAIVKVEDSEEEYIHLNHLSKKQGPFTVYNSHLSEYGVMGFEYGYSLTVPNGLTIWEAQFGDFFNGAQIIIDQFISSAEDKWKNMSGLVLLLPHGYEGMGPEHSSGRIERFLQLCAEENMQVANCTTPANYFHLLRRQLKRGFRKPLVVFTPKSLLRHPKCISTLDEMAKGGFNEVLDDTEAKANGVERVAFCSGKLYYDLLKRKEEVGANDVALVRVEQLYPLPKKQLDAVVNKYKNAKTHLWVQEEPENMGAWSYMLRSYREVAMEVVARPASASPASGSVKRYESRQTAIIDKVFEKYLQKKPVTA